MLKIIGNTPLIKIKYEYNSKLGYIYTKLESYNLTGSIKDRTVYYIITKAIERGELKENMPIIEATSGNTGISLAALGRYFHHKVYIFMPDWVSEEREKIITAFGATVIKFSHKDGGFKRCIEEAKKTAKKLNGFLSNQFSNEDNIQAQYETTGEEIIDGVKEKIYGFVSGIGTGGTLMGIGRRIKEKYQDAIITAIEPDSMPLISKNKVISPHKIDGIADEFIPKLVNKKEIDKTILINDDDAINMSRKLAIDLGLGVGISSGANFIGSVILQNEINKAVVTVFPDDNKKYLSTELTNKLENKKSYISSKIKLLSYEVC